MNKKLYFILGIAVILLLIPLIIFISNVDSGKTVVVCEVLELECPTYERERAKSIWPWIIFIR